MASVTRCCSQQSGRTWRHLAKLLPALVSVILVKSETVEADVGADSIPPAIVVHPQNIYIPLAQAKTLRCSATGVPKPKITWYKDGVKVVTQHDDPGSYYELVSEGDLLVLRAQRHHFGLYYCNATNELGSAISQNATVSMAYLGEEFRRPPEDVSVVAGREAQLHCQPPQGMPQPLVKWHVKTTRRHDFWVPPQVPPAGAAGSATPATPSGNSRRFTLDPVTGILTISNVHKADSGDYKCVAYNDVGEKPSAPARLIVWEKPLISEPPVHMIINQGQDAKFRCVVGGEPTPSVRWLKNSADLEGGGAAGGGRSIVMPDNSLVVRGVLPSDEGSYTCVATNDGGVAEATAHLTVNTPPEFLFKPLDKATSIGQAVLFHCIADGSPPPSVYWQKQVQTGEHMFPRHSYSGGKFSVSDSGTLRIDNVQMDDEGDYICHALNNAGHANASAKLRVREFDDSRPPVIIEGPSNVTTETSSSIVLNCRAMGNPTPVVRWQKNGRPVIAGSRFTISPGSLRIVDVYATDSGVYTCFVSSESGEATASAVLTVIGVHNSVVPSLIPSPPGKPHAVEIYNVYVLLAWTAGEYKSAPSTDYYAVEVFSYAEEKGWIQGRWTQAQLTGMVISLLPGTNYLFLVRAKNDYGVSEASQLSDSIRTTGEAVPENRLGQKLNTVIAPALTKNAVVVIRPPQVISSTAINVSWTIPDHTKLPLIEGFFVRTSSVRGQNVERVYSSYSTYRRVSNLHPNTLYQFAVAPFYSTVTGAPSDIAEARTLEDVPSGPPRNVRISRDGSRVLVTWEPVLEEHASGLLLGYVVCCIAPDKLLTQNFTVNATTTRLLVESLRPDVSYQLSLAAYTRVGAGVASSPQLLAAVLPDGQQVQSLVDEPWFLPTVIGIIGFTLCAVLFTLVICVCLRRRSALHQAKKDSASGIISVPLTNMPMSPQMYVAYQTDTSCRPPTPRSGGPRPSQTSDSVSRSISNANMSNKVDDYNLDGSESSQCHKTFYNKTADTTDVGGMGLYATTCLLGLNNKDGHCPADAVMTSIGGGAAGQQHHFQQMPNGAKGGGSSESSCTDNNGRPGSSSGGEQLHSAACLLSHSQGAAEAASPRGAAATLRDSPPGLPHFADILPPPPRHPPPPTADTDPSSCGQPLAPSAAALLYHHQHSAPTLGASMDVAEGCRSATVPHAIAYCHSCGGAAGYPVAPLAALALRADGSGGSAASSASSSRRTMPAQLHREQLLQQSGIPMAYGGAAVDYASCRDSYPHLYSTYGSQRSGGGSSGRSCHDYAEPEFLDAMSPITGMAVGGLGNVAGLHAACCQSRVHPNHEGHWDRPQCCAAAAESTEYDEPWGENPWATLWAAGAAPTRQQLHEHFACGNVAMHRQPLASSSSGSTGAGSGNGRAHGLLPEHLATMASTSSTAAVLEEADEDDWLVAHEANDDAMAADELLPGRSSDDVSSSSDDDDDEYRRNAESKERRNRMKRRAKERQRINAAAAAASAKGRPTSPYAGYSTDSSFVFMPRKPYPKAGRKKQIQRQQPPKVSTKKDMCVQAEDSTVRDRV